MQNKMYSPCAALNGSTKESRAAVNSAANSEHLVNDVSVSSKKPPPAIDPDTIILSDSDSDTNLITETICGILSPEHYRSENARGHASLVRPTTTKEVGVDKQPKKSLPKSKAMMNKSYALKKQGKKNKLLMKVSTSLFQRNLKQFHDKNDSADGGYQVEDSAIPSSSEEIIACSRKPSISTMKISAVVKLCDVLPNLTKEQLEQLQFLKQSSFAKMDANTSLNISNSLGPNNKPLDEETASIDTAGTFSSISVNNNELIDTAGLSLPSLALSPTTDVSQDNGMIQCSPRQLQKSPSIPYKKKQIIVAASTKTQTQNDSTVPMKRPNSKTYELHQSSGIERGQEKRHQCLTMVSNELASKQKIVMTAAQPPENDVVSSRNSTDVTDSTMPDLSPINRLEKHSQGFTAKDKNLALGSMPSHKKKKKRKKKHHKSKRKSELMKSTHTIDEAHNDSTRSQLSSFPDVATATQPVYSFSKPVQEHKAPLQINSDTQSKDAPECTSAYLGKDVILEEMTHDTYSESIEKPAYRKDLPEKKSLATSNCDEITHAKSKTKSLSSNKEVPRISPSKSNMPNKEKTSDPTLTLRPMLERLSPEKNISRTTSPEKACSKDYVPDIDMVSVELERLADKNSQDKAAITAKSTVLVDFKRKSEGKESSSKRSKRAKLTVKGERKKRKQSPYKSKTSDFSRLSPCSSKGVEKRKLRERKPVFYAEDDVSFDTPLKPSSVPKVTKERRFQHICLKQREDIYEIVIAVEAASHKHVDSSMSRKYNFLFVRTLNELINAFQICQQDKVCKAVVLSSVGPIFCSGLDPASLLSWSPEQPVVQDIIELMRCFVNMLIRYSKPIIAIVQGPAVGFGATLLLHCDSVYASDRASLQWPFAQIGLSPFGCTTEILKQTVGFCKTRSLLLDGHIISAQMAKDSGIITEIFRHDSLLANAWSVCSALRQYSEFALLQVKVLVTINFVKSLIECNDCETLHLKRCLKTPSCLKYLQRYVLSHLCLN